MAVIAVVADKGGVGKSTTARHLSDEAARRGLFTLAVDADKQADLTDLFDVRPDPGRGLHVVLSQDVIPDARDHVVADVRPGIDLVPSHPDLWLADRAVMRRTRRELILAQALRGAIADYDLVVIDVGHSDMVVENVLAVSDLIVIPTTVAWLDVVHVEHMIQDAATIRAQLELPAYHETGMVVVSVWRRAQRSTLDETGTRLLAERFGDMLAPQPIPHTVKVQEASWERMSVREYRDQRALARERPILDQAVEAYESLTGCVLERLNSRGPA